MLTNPNSEEHDKNPIDRYGFLPSTRTVKKSTPLPKSGWDMILGGVTVRKYLRNLRCFFRGHNAVHVADNIYQCKDCHAVGD